MKKLLLPLIIFFTLTVAHKVTNAQSISAGGQHSLYRCSNNNVMSCGDNFHGRLGDGTIIDRNTPVPLNSLNGITAISAGDAHSIFLKNDGTVWTCGFNGYGQLGDGTLTDRNTPVQITSLSGIIAIAAGGDEATDGHSLFLKNDGTVWACGNNSFGQLGDGTTNNNTAVVKVNGINGITAIAAGESHSLFLKNDGTVWSCGYNGYGQLGDGTLVDRNTPVQLSSLSGIIAISAGGRHSLFLQNNGIVLACGYNGDGELGDGTSTNNFSCVVSVVNDIIAISAGVSHSLFLKNDGTVWGCGEDYSGQLANGTTIGAQYIPVQSGYLSGITAIAAGNYFSLFLKNDGTVWGCGNNSSGQLGDSTNSQRTNPVQVIGLCSVAQGIEEDHNENNISVFPNPFSSTTTLHVDKILKNATLTVYDLYGQQVKQIKNILGQTVMLFRDNLPCGLYFLCLTENNKIFQTGKLVITDN